MTSAELTVRFDALGNQQSLRNSRLPQALPSVFGREDWATSDLALLTATEALKRAGRKPEDADLIIVGTASPGYIAPSTSVVLQHKLGAKNAGSFDVNCACAAFPTLAATGSGITM